MTSLPSRHSLKRPLSSPARPCIALRASTVAIRNGIRCAPRGYGTEKGPVGSPRQATLAGPVYYLNQGATFAMLWHGGTRKARDVTYISGHMSIMNVPSLSSDAPLSRSVIRIV